LATPRGETVTDEAEVDSVAVPTAENSADAARLMRELESIRGGTVEQVGRWAGEVQSLRCDESTRCNLLDRALAVLPRELHAPVVQTILDLADRHLVRANSGESE
jgi:hypothetical protein